MGRPNKTRTAYTTEIGRHRGDLYKRSLMRSKRALRAGFYIESIALTESLLADRLESCLTLITSQPVSQRTAAQAAKELRQRTEFADTSLLWAVSTWTSRRNRAVHEFAKINDEDGVLSWLSRLREAREVAETGLQLLEAVTGANKSLRRHAKRRERHD